MNAKDKLIKIVNDMISECQPIKYQEFNKFLPAKNAEELIKLEKIENKIGITTLQNKDDANQTWGITTLSVIATITDVLVDDRLCFEIDKDDNIVSVKWYTVQVFDENTDAHRV